MNLDPRRNSVLAADLMLAVVALIWGAGIPLSAVLARGLTPLWAVALRMLLASFFLMIMFRRTIMTSTARDWKISFLLTAVLTAVFTSMTFGLVFSTASKQAFIGGLNVILVPVFVWMIYRKRPSAWLFAGAGLTTAGLLVMGFTPGMEFNFGDFLSFIMAVTYALQVISSEYCARRVDPARLTALHIIMLSAVLTVLALIFEPLPEISDFTPKYAARCSASRSAIRSSASIYSSELRRTRTRRTRRSSSRSKGFSATCSLLRAVRTRSTYRARSAA